MARLSGSSPMHLAPILESHSDVTFDIFHGGYPWVHEVAALAHNYPNVRLNLTWLPQLTTSVAVAALKEWLQVAGGGRRLSWGGDCVLVEEAYGALLAARHTIAKALAELVDEGYAELESAIETARAILHEGGAETYRLTTGPAAAPRPAG
jgi:predicted TIM-barrel fold metal-dependent hydrolase